MYRISDTEMLTLGLITAWDLAWRGIALWQSSKRQQKTWFILLLFINSAGLLPIVYLIIHRGDGELRERIKNRGR